MIIHPTPPPTVKNPNQQAKPPRGLGNFPELLREAHTSTIQMSEFRDQKQSLLIYRQLSIRSGRHASCGFPFRIFTSQLTQCPALQELSEGAGAGRSGQALWAWFWKAGSSERPRTCSDSSPPRHSKALAPKSFWKQTCDPNKGVAAWFENKAQDLIRLILFFSFQAKYHQTAFF